MTRFIKILVGIKYIKKNKTLPQRMRIFKIHRNIPEKFTEKKYDQTKLKIQNFNSYSFVINKKIDISLI